MTPIKALFPLLILMAICPALQQRDEPGKCEKLTRAKVIELLGQPSRCKKETKNVECFGGQYAPYTFQFNDSGIVEQITMFNGCSGIQPLRKEMDRIVPENLRGKLQKKTDVSARGSCEAVNEEEYECVKIKFARELCMGCSPATITIVWKDDLDLAK